MSKCRWAWKSTCTPAQRANNKLHRGDLPGSRSELLLRAAAGRPIRTPKQRRLPGLFCPLRGAGLTQTLYQSAGLVERLRVRDAAFKRLSRRKSKAQSPHLSVSQRIEPKNNAKNNGCRRLRRSSVFYGAGQVLPFDLSWLIITAIGPIRVQRRSRSDGGIWRIERFRASPSIFAL